MTAFNLSCLFHCGRCGDWRQSRCVDGEEATNHLDIEATGCGAFAGHRNRKELDSIVDNEINFSVLALDLSQFTLQRIHIDVWSKAFRDDCYLQDR